MDETRKAFEAWATAEPREWNVSRCETQNGTLGLYCNVCTEKAWRAWQAACAVERKGRAMTNEEIHKIALAHGFTERLQPDGTTDLNAYVYDFARAMFEAGRSAATAETASVLRALIDAATERTSHRYQGNCPCDICHDARDPDCTVCRAIERAEKLLTDHAEEDIEMVAVPDSWRLVPTTPHGDMLRSVGKWADAMAYETYTACSTQHRR